MVLLFMPVIGIIFYLYFGHNFSKEKFFEGKKRLDYQQISRLVKEQSINLGIPDKEMSPEIRSKINIIRLLLGNGKSRLSKNNRVDILNNGPDTYSAIKEALIKAHSHIHLEYYIFEEGKIAEEILSILFKKVKEGVEVRLIYDKMGSSDLTGEFIERLIRNGIKIAPFRPVKFIYLTSKVNYRNHRKIIVVDGKEGFLGGINISDKYMNDNPEKGLIWRDTHVKIEGEAVKDLQLIFLTDWYFLTDEDITNESQYFPDTKENGECTMQVLASGPDTDYKGVMKAFFAAIATARKSIHITTPYFIPNESMITALKTAAGSGVDVQMIVPGISDSNLVHYSSQSYFDELLEAGVSIYRYKGGFVHAKLLLVDGILSTIGSANMDFRSFEYNLEVNALIYNKKVHSALLNQFHKDLKECEEVIPTEWKKRNRSTRIKESFSRVLAPLM